MTYTQETADTLAEAVREALVAAGIPNPIDDKFGQPTTIGAEVATCFNWNMARGAKTNFMVLIQINAPKTAQSNIDAFRVYVWSKMEPKFRLKLDSPDAIRVLGMKGGTSTN